MGQRVRLKAGFVIPPSWTKQEKAVLLGLKKYGALVADNGNFFSISVTPDDRWPAGCFNHFTSISITNFEVIVTTGPNEGPRSPGAPTASAGADLAVAPGQPAQLQGVVTYAGAPPETRWKLYAGPGTASFDDATKPNTTVSFSAPGSYTLMLSAADGVHAVAYDAVVITVTTGIAVTATSDGANLNLSWTGGSPPFLVERTDALPGGPWETLTTTGSRTAGVPLPNAAGFFRVLGQ